jgi:pimeloyl-ACP methyl ester carboxylesterase
MCAAAERCALIETRARWFDVNGVRLHAMEAGEGFPVVLLHGFPEFWFSWRGQIEALAAAGYHVVALDQRGYNLSSKPPGIASYRLGIIAQDVAEVIEGLGGRAAVIGHDWGGAVTWRVAAKRPDLVERMIAINVPHPKSLFRELKKLSQLRRFWYQFYFQIPVIPEASLRRRRFGALRGSLRRLSLPGTFSSEDLQKYVEAWSQPDALWAMLAWYRAVMRRSPRKTVRESTPAAASPAMLIWGETDPFFNAEAMLSSPDSLAGLRLERIAEGGHFVHEEFPDRVNGLILDFLRERA